MQFPLHVLAEAWLKISSRLIENQYTTLSLRNDTVPLMKNDVKELWFLPGNVSINVFLVIQYLKSFASFRLDV